MRRARYFLTAVVFIILAMPLSVRATELSDAQILHLLNRISFGPAPGDIDAVRTMGIDAYIDQQLNPAGLQTPSSMSSRLSELLTLNASMQQLVEAYGLPKNIKELPEDEAKELRKRQNIVVDELAEAKIIRAVSSPAQLQEVMTDFWFNHFNVFADKGPVKLMVGAYERDAIRPYALGKFSDLLKATAHHPAMLHYLDNVQNTDPNSIAARGRNLGINENYAREVMELHTLGVNGGYTQQDVTTLAHILTGWGVSEGHDESQRLNFYFEPRRHDFNTQNWLGYTIPGGGEAEIDLVLNILAHHPSTAKHIAYQLAQYFVADNPPASLVDKLASTFRSSDGDIAAVLHTLFHAPEFWDARYTQQKFKPPFRFVVSALRATGFIPQGDTKLLQGALNQMGEPLYRCLTPNGYAATNDQWLNSDALLKRIDFSKKLAGFLDVDAPRTIVTTLGNTWSESTISAAQNAEPKLRAAMLLSSPEAVYY